MKFPKNNIIDQWLDENGNPEIARLVEKNLAIANKITEILKVRGLKPADLARMLDKKPSEISKWLTGMHNFTTKTIVKIEVALAEDIIHTEPLKVYLKVMVNTPELEEETLFEKSEVYTNGLENDKKAS